MRFNKSSAFQCAGDYYNRKGLHFILMQGTVNHLGQFTDIYIGWPSRIHDARVFVKSTLYGKVRTMNYFPNVLSLSVVKIFPW